MKLSLLAALLLSPLALQATPTRLLTVDNMSQIVPDDYDATHYYSLAPNFKNNWYWDAYPTGRSFGWAFLDVGVGTLVVWYNKPWEGGALFDAASGFSPAAITGLSLADLNATITNEWDPREKRIQKPDNKLALGYALEVGDSLTLGFCYRLAQLNQVVENDSQNGVGAPGAAFGASSAYQASLGGNYAGLLTHKYSNTQSSNGTVISPQFSYTGDSFTLDTKFDMVLTGIDNKHSEEMSNGVGTGSITQTLKDKGRMSWYVRPKLRYMLSNESSLVLRGSYGMLDLSTEHRVKGNFSGAGFTTAEQAFDLADSTQELGITQWDFTLGVLNTWNKGKDMIIWGVVPQGQTAHLVATNYQGKFGATSYSDVVRDKVQDTTINTWSVPFVIGTELSLNNWCKARSSMQRNFFTSSDTKTTSDDFDSASVLSSRKITHSSSDVGSGWVVNMGFGLNFGSFNWDTALNTSFLGSNNAAFTNPLYQSSFTYSF